ncbi:MAG: N-acyl homoserine lactonase family protein [Lachnospiraceae bacterium]|nr:N-acyl homoserine lactonase family protein [Lachnospiraceae bacterium]
MENIRIHILHCGRVCVSPYLPFGGKNCSRIKAAGMTTRKKDRLWLPVSAYLIECTKGKILIDTGWSREMSPEGVYDRNAQIRHMSLRLYIVNQGEIAKGEAVHEQLHLLGIEPKDLDYVLLTHLDCDHASGVRQVREAKHILVSEDEMACAKKDKIRYTASMWKGVPLEEFAFERTGIGPVRKSYDLFGDGAIQLINIPGHSDGMFAVQITNNLGQYVLLYSDGGYASKSWQQLICSGIATDRESQYKSLEWISKISSGKNCLESIANHDPDVIPHTIQL